MKRLYIHLLHGAMLSFGGFAACLASARFGTYSDIMILVFLAGCIGAVVNNYFRLGKMVENRAIPEGDAQERLAIVQMYASMCIAGILAFASYGLFLGGLVGGDLFPKFEHEEKIYQGLTSLLFDFGPKTNLDAVKCVIWGFVAGFSERFVPNFIDNLIVKSNAKEGRLNYRSR